MQLLVTPDEARQIVLAHIPPLEAETVPHAQALGRTLARDIVSEIELPPFDNSAMDGYALRAADLSGALPALLRVLETIAAGAFPRETVIPGTASRIMTGAPLPPGADAIVMREDTRESQHEVEVLERVNQGANIRRAGSDVARGETVLRRGEVVGAAQWGMLSSLDQSQVVVSRQPRVLILTTGDELIPLGTPLEPGQIRDSNSFTLSALSQSCGALASGCHVGDNPRDLERALDETQQSGNIDAVITSGGVSVGDFDPVRDVLRERAQVHFWKIAMKPGKPVMFASWPGGDHGIPVFGLPGNPVSVMVAFEQFVRPALLQMQGRLALRRVTVEATLNAPLRSPADKTEFVRAFVRPDGVLWRADLTGDQSSGRLSTMTRANALLVVPQGTAEMAAGQTLTAQMTDWPEIE